jgi:hypothetical protein
MSHGEAGARRSPEYRTWLSMLTRCRNPKSDHWPGYGGRGITVCARWNDSYEAFLEDVGRRPSLRHTLDRVDNAGNYEPGNVRWATPREQSRNRRSNRLLEFRGEVATAAEWAERFGLRRSALFLRLSRGWSLEDALTKPLRVTVRPVREDHQSTPEAIA